MYPSASEGSLVSPVISLGKRVELMEPAGQGSEIGRDAYDHGLSSLICGVWNNQDEH
jgi:hypothetical protein